MDNNLLNTELNNNYIELNSVLIFDKNLNILYNKNSNTNNSEIRIFNK